MSGSIFWASVAGFLLGVFARSLLPLGLSFAALLALLGGAAALAAFAGRVEKTACLVMTAVLCSAALGVARMHEATLKGDPLLTNALGQRVTVEGVVAEEPDVRQDSLRLSIEARNIVGEGTRQAVSAGVLVVLPEHTAVSYGDSVRVSGVLKVPAPFAGGNGRQFDYPSYLAAQGIEYELSSARLAQAVPRSGNPLKAFAIWIQQAFERGLALALPEPAAAFAGGITVGDKRSIGPALAGDFRTAGLMHLVVLSGYNITVVLNAAAWLVYRTPLLRGIRVAPLGVSSLIVALFYLMSGGASSAARAGVMALIAVAARMSRRTFLASRALASAGVLIVAWDPFALAFDPGFELSALSTAGLIALTPIAARHMRCVTARGGLREIAASTICTQLAVLPLLAFQNGSLSLYALPANLLALPLVPYAMFASLVAGIAGIAAGPLAAVASLPAYLLLSYLLAVAGFIARLPYAALALPAFGAWWLVPVYAALFAGAAYAHAQKNRSDARAPAAVQ